MHWRISTVEKSDCELLKSSNSEIISIPSNKTHRLFSSHPIEIAPMSSESWGWDLSLFEDSQDELVKRDVVCPICTNVLRDPVIVVKGADPSGCQHIFCKSCLERWEHQALSSSEEFRCPLCRERIDSVIEDKASVRRMANIVIQCPIDTCNCKGTFDRVGSWWKEHEEMYHSQDDASLIKKHKSEDVASLLLTKHTIEEQGRQIANLKKTLFELKEQHQQEKMVLLDTIKHQKSLWELQRRILVSKFQSELNILLQHYEELKKVFEGGFPTDGDVEMRSSLLFHRILRLKEQFIQPPEQTVEIPETSNDTTTPLMRSRH